MKLQLLQDLSYEHFTLYSIGDDEFMKDLKDLQKNMENVDDDNNP
jgi:hypothetical protein